MGRCAHPSFCSGRTSNIGHQFLTSFLYLYSAAVPGRQLVNSQPSQSPNVVRHPIEHPTHIQSSMTLPTRPHAIFSTLQGTQNPDTKPTLQRAKNANAQPTHPGRRIRPIIISNILQQYIFTRHQAHPPPHKQTHTIANPFMNLNRQ